MSVINAQYAAVLADMGRRKQRLEAELAELDTAIQAIRRLVALTGENGSESHESRPSLQPAQPKPASQLPRSYAGISVRWAVLWHLSEEASSPEKTGEIASALLAGGFQSKASNFSNLVSGVLSLMKQKGEISTTEDGSHMISDEGRRTWQLIRQGTKFREATANAPSLLSVQ
jgi:hypothetical protein